MDESGLEIELSAEEEDADSVAGEGMEPACRRLDSRDLAVEALADCIGNRVPPPGHHVSQPLLGHPRDFLHRFELAVDRLSIPFLEVFLRFGGGLRNDPEEAECLFDEL